MIIVGAVISSNGTSCSSGALSILIPDTRSDSGSTLLTKLMTRPLSAWGAGSRNGRAQMAEARRPDDPKTTTHKIGSNGEAQIKAAAGTVDRQQRNACTAVGVFDRADVELGDQTASADGVAQPAKLVRVKQESH